MSKRDRDYISLCLHDREHWFVCAVEAKKARWLRCVNCGLMLTESKQKAAVDPKDAKGQRVNANR